LNNRSEKNALTKEILHRLYDLENILSVTIVGSYVDQKKLTNFSDIDTIVICNKLSKINFENCIAAISSISLEKLGINSSIKINSTFGPLKFDSKNNIVIHLMIYGLKEHQDHVINSPFTCLDWERSNCRLGKSLKKIFPTGRIQPRDFIESRRGVSDYIEDLKSESISVRNYNFKNNIPIIEKNKHNLDKKHIGEFGFHIVRNLISNHLKLSSSENRYFSNKEVISEIKKIFPLNQEHQKKFDLIAQVKLHGNSKNYPKWTLAWIKKFTIDFDNEFIKQWENVRTIHFIRHAKTFFNDNKFLGQGRDPKIQTSITPPIDFKFKQVYTSPARRCIETVKLIAPQKKTYKDARLSEINYGSAEGLTIEQVAQKHPEFANKLANGDDPKFPGGGENTKEVQLRLVDFLRDLIASNSENSLVVTHNVILRCLIGEYFGISSRLWFKIFIPHALPLEFLCLNGKLYPNIPRYELKIIFKDLVNNE
jgi:ribonuclease H / adenosylcobalamin/alpha-ribazole phosphatase